MYYKNKIISAFANDGCKEVSGKVIKKLRTMREGMHSGDDSPLKNIWDEICVQVQIQESQYWELYEDTAKGLILSELKPLKEEMKQSIWLQTKAGGDWDTEIEGQIDCGEVKEYEVNVEYNANDIAEHIFQEYIRPKAGEWKNTRIEKYIDQGYDSF
jgi:hypothetical protein